MDATFSCWMLHVRPFAHPVACRWMSWVGGHCMTFETGQTISPVQTDAILLASNTQNRCYFWSVCIAFCWFQLTSVLLKNLTLIISPADTNECESSPCLNNGNCTDRINAFNCSCSPGFAGNRCEIG